MTNYPIGFSSGFFYRIGMERSLLEKLRGLASTGTEVLEIHLTDLLSVVGEIGQEERDLISSFSYRSIHLPGHLRYPSPETEGMIKDFLPRMAEIVKPHAVILHPDTVNDFAWVQEHIQPIVPLAMENMDWRRDFGSSVEDMTTVFELLPEAKWVFDVNHIYTLDPSMELGRRLYEKFSDRLTHYHLSGFGSKEIIHACLCETKEDVILTGLMNDGKPIVLESVAHVPESTFQTERDYVTDRL